MKHNRFRGIFWVCMLVLQLISLAITPVKAARIIYVKWDATGANNGTSWVDAYRDLTPALTESQKGDEVWVSRGTYQPSTTDSSVSFWVKPIHLYGGFEGTETSPAQRDLSKGTTVISGEIGQPDLWSDNIESLIKFTGSDFTQFWIDGFTITGSRGVALNDVAWDVEIWLVNDIIVQNHGGGMHHRGGVDGKLYVINSAFLGNNKSIEGAGISSVGADIEVINSIFIGNHTLGETGGAIYCIDCSVSMSNSAVLFNQSAKEAAGVYVSYYSRGAELYNSIFWNNIAPSFPHFLEDTKYLVSYSLVEGGASGVGNLSMNPGFQRMPSPGTDATWGTADDDYGDLRTLPTSPLIDAGSNLLTGKDLGDLNWNGQVTDALPFDLEGQPRFQDIPTVLDTGDGIAPIVDIGPYEQETPKPYRVYLSLIQR